MESEPANPDKPNQAQPEDQPKREGGFSDFFRFASSGDFFLLFFGLLCSFLNGAGFVAFALVCGLAMSTFDTRFTEEQMRDYAKTVTFYFFGVGVIIFIGTFGSRTLLRINAQRQGYNIRRAYFRALVHKEPSFYDTVNPMEISSQVENDCKAVVNTLDGQLDPISYMVGTLVCALAMALLRSWVISLMVMCAVPFILATVYLNQRLSMKAAQQRAGAYEKAGGIAEQALTSIRTVVALGGEKTEAQRYDDEVKHVQSILSRTALYSAMSTGFGEMVSHVTMGVVFYIASSYVEEGRINPTTGNPYLLVDLFTPISVITMAFAQLPILTASLKGITFAQVKIRKILDIVDSVKFEEENKKKLDDFKGSISFNNVSFAYPTQPEKTVLHGLSVDIQPNMKIAFVGESGSGKSTIIQLLQKFYDPASGSIEFDGHDLRTLDTSWLRKNVAYVGQEPVLFSMTIRENLLLAKEDATEDELIQALRRANAYNFVMDMENKLETTIGGGEGAQLSGGQKQRLAIARAILKNSRVLLLDEATSALDRLSEKEIQATLDSLAGDRTIILIAHRLSTIQAADLIVVLDQGKVVEKGSHGELLASEGKYFGLQAPQADMETRKESPTEILIPPEKTISQVAKTLAQNEDNIEDEEDNDDESSHFVRHKLSRQASLSSQVRPDEHKETLTYADIKSVWSFTKDERKYFYLGFLGSIGNALVVPLGYVVSAGAYDTLIHGDDPNFESKISIYCLLKVLVGVAVMLFYIMELGLFAKASETFTQTLRTQTFYKFLRMEIGWHDLPKHSAGSLTTSLEADTANVGRLTGTSLGLVIQIVLTNMITLLITFVVCWQMALAGVIMVPVVLLVTYKQISDDAKGEKLSEAQARRAEVIISEVFNNMKTVISLDAERKFLKEYSTQIEEMHRTRLKTGMTNGLLEGGMYLILFTDMAGMFYLGSNLYFSMNLSPMSIFIAVFALSFTAFSTTQLFFLMPDTSQAFHSIKVLLSHLERKSKIDIEDKRKVYKGKIQGNIEFRNVSFSYPTRPAKIFENLNFMINSGKQIGFTGPSGCGKTTIIQLLLRFYDVDSGEIFIEDINIQEYDLRYLRKKIGCVFQEPVLFNESIEYNIKYANPDVSDQEMIEACRKANALTFIQANVTSEQEEAALTEQLAGQLSVDPLIGFKRNVGSKGGQLSGGQKQRIAIARAILRKPKILLLDEATSALDSQSEAIVQDALNKVSQGLTTICIAHRLSTIRGMDEILVLKEGVVVERGNFDDLIAKKGHFYELKEASH